MSRTGSTLRDGLTSLAITAVLLTVVNFLFVHFALKVFAQPYFPRALLKHIDPCYQTFYHNTHGAGFVDWVAVVGDSYAAGSGDEFLARNPDYGIFTKLRSRTNGNYFVFARAGFGSINAARELNLCMSILNDSFLLPHADNPAELLFVFYEGNDLNNNIDHLAHAPDGQSVEQFVQDQVSHPEGTWRRRVGMHFPLYELIGGELADIGRSLSGGGRHGSRKAAADRDEGRPEDASIARGSAKQNYAIVGGQARLVPENPQSAAVELTGNLDVALRVFSESVLALHRTLPDTRITIVYLPSVVTTYSWQDPIRVQAYESEDPVFTTTRDNEARSLLIRGSIAAFAAANHFGFVDPTASLQSAARDEPVHGPRDWKHFNSAGNRIVADAIAGRRDGLPVSPARTGFRSSASVEDPGHPSAASNCPPQDARSPCP